MKMSRYVWGIAVAVVLVGLAGLAQADTMNILTNSDCASGSGGWSLPGGTGYSTGDGRPSSIYISNNNAARNMTSHQIVAGETFSLTWDAANLDDRSAAAPNLCGQLVFQNVSTVTNICYNTVTVTQALKDWQTYDSVSFTAVAGQEYIGKEIGVNFTTQGIWTDYTGIDKVYLNFTAASAPEPSGLVLVSIGLISLLAYAWRKRRCVPS
jgi:hypothetical protein